MRHAMVLIFLLGCADQAEDREALPPEQPQAPTFIASPGPPPSAWLELAGEWVRVAAPPVHNFVRADSIIYVGGDTIRALTRIDGAAESSTVYLEEVACGSLGNRTLETRSYRPGAAPETEVAEGWAAEWNVVEQAARDRPAAVRLRRACELAESRK